MEAWQLYRDAGSSRAFLASVRRSVRELDEWRYVMDEGADAYSVTGENTGGGIGNPTESRALYLVENDDRVRDYAAEQYRRCIDVIGAGLVVVACVRRGLGDRYADVLDGYYVDALSFSEVADECGISKPLAIQRRDIAADWLDSLSVLDIF